MIADLFTKPLMSPIHNRLAATMLSNLPDRIVQLSEEARVSPRQVALVDGTISADGCIIDLEGFEDEENACNTRPVGCQAVIQIRRTSTTPRAKYRTDRWAALMRKRCSNMA